MGQDGDQQAASRREAERHSFFLLADIFDERGLIIGRLRVRNLSATGAMGDSDLALEPQRRILLELRGVGAVSGEVVWAVRGKVGIRFNGKINPHLALKPVGRPTRNAW